MSLELKDIHLVLKNLRMEGHRIEELETLLVHSDDLRDLLGSIPYYQISHDSNEIRLYGVKIIESPYVQPGSIFKVFKNGQQYVYSPNTTPSPLTFTQQNQKLIKLFRDSFTLKPCIDDTVEEEKEKKYSQTRKIELG